MTTQPRPIEADNDGLPKDYCDRHGGYVDEGRTQPVATGSPYRICDGCVDEARRRIAAETCPTCGYQLAFHAGDACPQELGPNGARYSAGDA